MKTTSLGLRHCMWWMAQRKRQLVRDSQVSLNATHIIGIGSVHLGDDRTLASKSVV